MRLVFQKYNGIFILNFHFLKILINILKILIFHFFLDKNTNGIPPVCATCPLYFENTKKILIYWENITSIYIKSCIKLVFF